LVFNDVDTIFVPKLGSDYLDALLSAQVLPAVRAEVDLKRRTLPLPGRIVLCELYSLRG